MDTISTQKLSIIERVSSGQGFIIDYVGYIWDSVSVLSRKFWSAEISVRRTKITGKIGPPGPNFPGKIGPTLEIMVRV